MRAFYSFWGGFKSWREFARGDTERVGDSASRDERRHVAQKNKKNRELLKKEEIARLRRLVTAAESADPRLHFLRAYEQEEKKLAKKRAYDKKKADADAAAAAAAEARAAAAAAAEAEARARARAAGLLQRRQMLRLLFAREPALAAASGFAAAAVATAMVEVLAEDEPAQVAVEAALKEAKINLADPRAALAQGALAAMPAVAAVAERARARVATNPAAAAAEDESETGAAAAAAATTAAAASGKWTIPELGTLIKAMEKVPAGSRDRWAKVSALVGSKSEKDVLRRVKDQELAQSMGSGGDNVQMAQFRERVLREMEAAVAHNRRAAQGHLLLAGDGDATSTSASASASASTSTSTSVSANGVSAKKDDKKDKDKSDDKKSSSSSSSSTCKAAAPAAAAAATAPAPGTGASPAAAATAAATAAAVAGAATDVWSASQQACFEDALRTVSKDAPDRWAVVAGRVPGKTRAQCFARYKMILEHIKSKKAAAAAAAAGGAQ